jgi:hypothetical protein
MILMSHRSEIRNEAVIAGLDPVIQVSRQSQGTLDARIKPGHDMDGWGSAPT